MNTINAQDISRFRKELLTWYHKNKRTLPWRNTDNPFHVLVSEFMLQQTQVSRVLGYFERFITELPSLEHLADVESSILLKLWSGLGYNSRAIRLRETARIIIEQHGGTIPDSYEDLIRLPGIGDYMACSIPAFAYNKPLPVIDTNIRRVLITRFQLEPTLANKALKPLALACIPKGKSREWHNALMDYGSAMTADLKKQVPPLSRQSRFQGSFRQVRGTVVRLLIEYKAMPFTALMDTVKDERLPEVLDTLVKEGILILDSGSYRFL